MKAKGFPKYFSLSCWVEGPLEGMMDLSTDVEEYKSRLQNILALGIMVMVSSLILLGISLFINAWNLVYPFINSTVPTNVTQTLTVAILALLFMAISFITILLILQIWRYITVMNKRFENVEDLFGMSGTGENVEDRTGSESKEPAEMKGLFNLLGASTSFTKDIVQNMPQVSKQMKFIRTLFYLMPLYYLILRFVLPLLFTDGLEPVLSGSIGAVYEMSMIAISLFAIYAGLCYVEAGRFIDVIYGRMKVLDGVNSAPLPLIPESNSPAESLVQYLKGSHKCYEVLEACHADEYIIKHESSECVVLALITYSPPTVELVKDFTKKVQELLDNIGPHLPPKGRFIVLYSPKESIPGEIGDDVSEFLIHHPLSLGKGPGGGRSETIVQIMIEEEGAYGLFPFVE